MPDLSPARPRLFISHQWRDKQVAERLARDLEPLGEVWIDYRGLRPGDPIQATIDDVLDTIDLVLVLWTENAQSSAGVRKEIERCVEIGARIVPCILAHDEEGRPLPPLAPPLDQLLGVDFHHRGTAIALIAELIVHQQAERIASGVVADDHPGRRLLSELRGYLNYLANYRSLHGVADERGEWVDRIVSEIERYVHAGGDAGAVRALLAAARASETEDSEGIGMLVTRLTALLGEEGGATSAAAGAAPEPEPRAGDDALSRRIAAAVRQDGEFPWERAVDTYLASAPPALEALTAFARSTGSAAGGQVVTALEAYLDDPDDLIPDAHGRLGRADDAWLILNTAYRLIESGLVPIAQVPIDWEAVLVADPLIRDALPPAVLQALTAGVHQMLELIATEVASYEPWFSPRGHGYTPTMPTRRGGRFWEDEMNEMLLGTGLSV